MVVITRLVLLSILVSLISCGGGGSGGGSSTPPTPAPPPPPADQAIGGVWVGTDNSGIDILALSTESGRVHWLAPTTGEQGFGTGTTSGTTVNFDYTYVAPFGFTLADGSNFANCSASGTIAERQSVAVVVNCTTGSGGMLNDSASLSYNTLYERDSSLSAIAGNYNDSGSVVNVNSNGVIFEQDPSTGCIINGQVTIIDSRFNAYDVTYTFSNCSGFYASLNGATFNGLSTLDNTVSPERAIIGVTGQVGGVTYSRVLILPRT